MRNLQAFGLILAALIGLYLLAAFVFMLLINVVLEYYSIKPMSFGVSTALMALLTATVGGINITTRK